MHTFELAWDAVWRVFVVGLILGAGLPTLFAAGIRAMAYGQGGAAEVDTTAAPHPAGRLVGYLCFAIVLLVVALGITYIVAFGLGYELSFSNVYPTLEPK